MMPLALGLDIKKNGRARDSPGSANPVGEVGDASVHLNMIVYGQ
jgi:hypothetical protein